MNEQTEMLEELRQTVEMALNVVSVQPMVRMSEKEILELKLELGDFDLIIGNFGVKRIGGAAHSVSLK